MSDIQIDAERIIARLRQRLDAETMTGTQYAALADQLTEEKAALESELAEVRGQLAQALNAGHAIVLAEDGSRVDAPGEATEARAE